MSVIDYFSAAVALDQNQRLIRDAEADVYALSDTTFSTPLAITDLQGVPMAKLRSSAEGIYPDFRVVSGAQQILAKSGDRVTPMTSLGVIAKAAEDAAAAASSAASSATGAAETAVTARGEAVAAKEAAEAVGTTNDTVIAGRINDTSSATRTALNTTIGATSVRVNEAPPMLTRYGTTEDANAAFAAAFAAMPAGGHLYVPPGVWAKGGTRSVVPDDVTIEGLPGAKILGRAFQIGSRSKVTGLHYIGDGQDTAILNLNTSDPTDSEVSNSLFEGFTTAGVQLRQATTGLGPRKWKVLGNDFRDNANSVFVEKAYDCLIAGNGGRNAAGVGRHFTIYGGRGNVIEGNDLNGGIGGIMFIYTRNVAGRQGKIRGNIASGNTVAGFTEEGITFDARGNSAAGAGVIDQGTVGSKSYNSSVRQMTLTLAEAAFAGSGSTLSGYDCCIVSGPLAGQVFSIGAHSGAAFTLTDVPPEVNSAIAAGVKVVIGAAFLGNVAIGNHVDARLATSYGLGIWGMGFGNQIKGNTLWGTQTSAGARGTLRLASLGGILKSDLNVTDALGTAPCMNNVVDGNSVNFTDIEARNWLYSGAAEYDNYGNRFTRNILNSGVIRLDRQQNLTSENVGPAPVLTNVVAA